MRNGFRNGRSKNLKRSHISVISVKICSWFMYTYQRFSRAEEVRIERVEPPTVSPLDAVDVDVDDDDDNGV